MRSPIPPTSAVWLGLGAALLVATGAFGQAPDLATRVEPGADAPSALLERGAVRIRYGVALRDGAQQDLGPGVTYQGMTPNDVAVSGGWFPLKHLGLALSVHREGFSLMNGTERVTGGALLRGGVGPVGRVLLGPVKLEAQVGYAFAQLPAFTSSVQPVFAAVTRHGVLLASRASIALPAGIVAEARGEYPLALSAADASGQPVQARGFGGGAGISIPVFHGETSDWRLGLDYQYVADDVTAGGLQASQRISRVGAVFQVDLLQPGVPRPPKVGGIAVIVTDAATGEPIPHAQLAFEVDGGAPQLVALGADGKAAQEGLPPGTLVAKVTAAGYLPAQEQTEIIAGRTATLAVRVKKEPPRVGALAIKVTDKASNAPVAGATVKVRNLEQTTGEDGTLLLEGLAPGIASITVTAPGYKPGEEAAQIVVGKTSELPVVLVKEKQKLPATISGIVRSTRGGQPIRAVLEIPELKLKVNANAEGAFSFTVPAGTFRVIIAAPGYRQQTKQVTVREGDQTIFNVDLHPRSR